MTLDKNILTEQENGVTPIFMIFRWVENTHFEVSVGPLESRRRVGWELQRSPEQQQKSVSFPGAAEHPWYNKKNGDKL